MLEGVSGAVISMHDGFLVAGQLPPEHDLEAFAALVPEMHSRVNQFASNLKLNPSDTVTLALGDLPLLICKTPSVFFAALGKPRATLPAENLAIVIRHLDAPTS